MKIGQKEIGIAHFYNHEAWANIPATVRTAERLGYDVELHISKDGMGKIHSVQVFATLPEKKES